MLLGWYLTLEESGFSFLGCLVIFVFANFDTLRFFQYSVFKVQICSSEQCVVALICNAICIRNVIYIRNATTHEHFAFISSRASHYSTNHPCSPASKLASSLSVCLSIAHCYRGDKGIRTLDPLLARQVLSQLSYTPINLAATCSPIPSPV